MINITLLAISVLLSSASTYGGENVWPVSEAKNGFSADEATDLKASYKSAALGLAGNAALYTYLNMAEFYPHQLLDRDGQIKSLREKPNGRIGGIKVKTSLGDLSLDEFVSSPLSRLQGIVVIHKGKVVYEKYPGMQPTDSHLWWSVAKVIAGLLTEMLIEEGQIDPNTTIDTYLKEFKGTVWEGVKVAHILHQASGIDAVDSTEAYGDPHSGIGKLMFAQGVLKAPGLATGTHNQVLREMTRLNPPGKKYQYSSANTNMLGLLIEHITGQRYGDVIQQRIWSQIGAEGDALLGLTPDGRAIAHGMFSSRLRDLARFGMLFTPSGYDSKVANKKLLARIGDVARTDYYRHAPTARAIDASIHGEPPVSAPSQWGALFADGGLFKSGFQGQALYVSPSRDVVIAMFSTANNPQGYKYLRPLASAF
ncbi:serine hydrolase domain-containing protein [Zhongshania aquimaris]|uniref:Beta-lactamase family protein n=1 Tax=Zhongshania aquimaris TaxID=2857107 RepID=A0ABS6VQ13_9GAMM|nr:serine hydrolase domain-containing protein [Zhongshania aquimaris]MBW2940124.1 beta-lactamase family protein [Zhongshania aquimaris]